MLNKLKAAEKAAFSVDKILKMAQNICVENFKTRGRKQ